MSEKRMTPTGPTELVTMRSGETVFGIPVLRVRDVLDAPTIFAVPLAPPEIVGSINLRGRIVTAIDLRTRLDQRPRETDRCMCVIVERQCDGASEPYALLVDEIGEVMTLAPSAYEPNPTTLSPEWAAVSQGLFRQPDGLIIILNIDAVLDGVGRRRAA